MVRWQSWQRITGRRETVTGNRREFEVLIGHDHARPAHMTSHCGRRYRTICRRGRLGIAVVGHEKMVSQ